MKSAITALSILSSLLVNLVAAGTSGFPNFEQTFKESTLIHQSSSSGSYFHSEHFTFTTNLEFKKAIEMLKRNLGENWKKVNIKKELVRYPNCQPNYPYVAFNNTNEQSALFVSFFKKEFSKSGTPEIHITAYTIPPRISPMLGDFPDTKDTGKLNIHR